ncbi:MAG: M1 family aminopeptidase [Bacillota bacterium]
MKKIAITCFLLMLISITCSFVLPLSPAFLSLFTKSDTLAQEEMTTPENHPEIPSKEYPFKEYPVYTLQVQDKGTYLEGALEIIFTNSWGEDLNKLQLNLPANLQGKENIKVKSILFNHNPVPLEQSLEKIVLQLPDSLTEGDSASIYVEFETHYKNNFTRFGKYDDITLLALWYPVLAPRKDGRWIDFQWVDYADPYYFESAQFNLEFYTDEYLVTPFPSTYNGQYYSLTTPPVRDLTLVLGPFKKTSFKLSNRLEISYYYKTPRPELLEIAVDTFIFYQNRYGYYPYPSMTIIDVPLNNFKGMEFSGIIFLNQDENINVFTLAHEISHQWWHTLVGNDQITESWIDESLANYSAYKYCKSRHLPAALLYKAYFALADQKYSGQSMVKHIKDFPSETVYRQMVYLKGANFWLKIEDKIGEKALIDFLKNIQQEYRHKIIDTQIILTGLSEKFKIPYSELEKMLN